jgi:DNA-binding NarL/FixJ family response regulator
MGYPASSTSLYRENPSRAVTLVRREWRGTVGAAGVLGTGGPGEVARSARRPATAPVAIAVLATDPISAEGTIAYLRGRPGVTPLTADGIPRADVVLILATWITEETISLMQRAAEQAAARDVRYVLVGDGMRKPQLLRAVSFGLVTVLPRQGTDHERIVRAILAVCEDRVEMPDVALGWLLGQIQSIQRNVLTPNGLTAAGLESREVDVLRLLADGLDTVEIAGRLSYSERTVKNIIHGVVTRLKLRNRPHAVAFALRNGLL